MKVKSVDDASCNINYTTLIDLNSMIKEALKEDQFELRVINRIVLDIASKLTFYYQDDLEYKVGIKIR